MPHEFDDVRLAAQALVAAFDEYAKLEESPDLDDPVLLAFHEAAQKLYRMLRHVPGVHSDGDAPERQN